MVVITNESATENRTVKCPKGGFVSIRYLIQDDGMGFGLHRTEIPKGDWQHWHYKRHREACYCVSGNGLLKRADTGTVFEIKPGTCYVLNNYDDHYFRALTDVVLISVFNPPVTGREVHDESGSY